MPFDQPRLYCFLAYLLGGEGFLPLPNARSSSLISFRCSGVRFFKYSLTFFRHSLRLTGFGTFVSLFIIVLTKLDLRALLLHRHHWVRLRMTHPGVGPVTALATDVFLGDPQRFADGKALASYVGMIPREYSSGERQRLGALTKQGSPLLRFLWGEAAAHAARRDPELQRFYRRKLVQKGLGKARVAVARKLGIRLWIMLRDQIDYNEFCRRAEAKWCRLCGDA